MHLFDLQSKENSVLQTYFSHNKITTDRSGASYVYIDGDVVEKAKFDNPEHPVLYVGEHKGFVSNASFSADASILYTTEGFGKTCAWYGHEKPLQRGQTMMGMQFTRTFGDSNRGELLKHLESLSHIDT
ncbi:MAG: hypothetical protein M3Z56_10260, partial [Bacteroidota bacterium]|nr:hypothetical protein [Bacteroidota bacterium]